MKFGALIPPGDITGDGAILSYREIRALALTAEETGLDSVWIYDHLVFGFPGKPRAGVWDVWTVMSGLAEATERVELGTLVLCTAFRNPAVLAKMAVTLDEMSGQRLILGLGAGWHEPEFTMFGFPFDHLVDRFEEALKIITPLVREGAVDFQGVYESAVDCEILPGPSRNIPVLIAARGPRMLRLTATYADSWNTAWFGDAAGIAPSRDKIGTAAAEVGRDPSTIEVTVGLNIAFPDLGAVSAGADDPAKHLSGTVEEIAASLKAYVDAGVGHVIAWIRPLNDESLRRYAEAVRLARS